MLQFTIFETINRHIYIYIYIYIIKYTYTGLWWHKFYPESPQPKQTLRTTNPKRKVVFTTLFGRVYVTWRDSAYIRIYISHSISSSSGVILTFVGVAHVIQLICGRMGLSEHWVPLNFQLSYHALHWTWGLQWNESPVIKRGNRQFTIYRWLFSH